MPIEYQLVTSRELPKMVASFFCSALESCSNIFGDRIRMACFHVGPKHLKCCHGAVAMIYEYFERRANADFVVIKMDGSQDMSVDSPAARAIAFYLAPVLPHPGK